MTNGESERKGTGGREDVDKRGANLSIISIVTRSKYILFETRKTFLLNPREPVSRIYPRRGYAKTEKRGNALEDVIFCCDVNGHLNICEKFLR